MVNIAEIQKHLVSVSKEAEVKRLKELKLDHLIKELPKLALDGHLKSIGPDEPALKHHFVHVEPRTLEDLKLWAGVPSDIARHSKGKIKKIPFSEAELPKDTDFNFDRLPPQQQKTVLAAARDLLIGDVDPKNVERPPLAGVVRYMLHRARKFPVFLASDLIVYDGETVELKGAPLFVFNNVIVYGSGEIRLETDCKIVAESVQHRAAAG